VIPSDPCGPTLRHVLVVGVDGVRFDMLGPQTTPAIWALGRDGVLSPVVIDEATPTISGPCRATIVTGAGVGGHRITGDDLTGHRLADRDQIAPLVLAALGTLARLPGRWRARRQGPRRCRPRRPPRRR
jgi:hypothetical protein